MVFNIVLEQISQIMIFAANYVVPMHSFFLSSSKAIADIDGEMLKIFFSSG